jgi:hypothetical protein
MSILRPPQEDLTISIAENLVPKELPDTMTDFLKAAKSTPIVRKYNFASLSGWNAFPTCSTVN